MKLITGWVMSAGLVLAATAANAQVLAPYGVAGSRYTVVSDVGGPYAAMEAPVPATGYGPTLLPPQEVYTVLRESGFSPLGIPQRRGLVYTIAVIDRGGEDGRLVIDARSGRILRFMPAYRMGDNLNDDSMTTYGPVGPASGPLPPVSHVRGPPRPPLAIPRVASRTPSVPVPRASPSHTAEPAPLAARPAAEAVKPAPEPAQRSAAAPPPAKPVDAQAAAPAAPAAVEAKPAPPQVQLQPTQTMPKAQGLD